MERIEYTGQNGYTGILYGNSSLIMKDGDRTIFHTGYRNIDTYDELVEFVEHGYQELVDVLRKYYDHGTCHIKKAEDER